MAGRNEMCLMKRNEPYIKYTVEFSCANQLKLLVNNKYPPLISAMDICQGREFISERIKVFVFDGIWDLILKFGWNDKLLGFTTGEKVT